MLLDAIQNTNSLKAVSDTVSQAVSPDGLSSLSINFSNVDTYAVVLCIMGYMIVFAALVILYIFFTGLAKGLNFKLRKKLSKSGEIIEKDSEISVSGEVNAAIAMALLLHFQEIHDMESTVLTIEKVQRTYSPWSSKIYGLRQYPR